MPQDFVADLTSARDKLAGGGKLGLFAKDAKRAIGGLQVDGVIPTTLEQAQRCLDTVQVNALRHRIAVIWQQPDAAPGRASAGRLPRAGHPRQARRDRRGPVVATALDRS